MHKIRVWDLPTRFFHWALVLAVVGLVVTSQIGGSAMPWHFRCGYLALSLLLFRLIWGFVGGHWSRFASFTYSPNTTISYLKGQGRPEHSVGHSPSGAGSVYLMLFFLLLQVGTGLFSEDKGESFGPLSQFVSDSTVHLLTGYHRNFGKRVLLVLLTLHVLAILYYWIHKKVNLVRPMIHGDKLSTLPFEDSRDDIFSRCVGAAAYLICAGLVAAIVIWVD